MKTRVLLILVSMMLIMGMFGGTMAAAPQTIKFGITIPITGANALWADIVRHQTGMARDEINAAGGILGRQLEIIYEDNQSTVTGGIVAFQKMMSEHPDMVAIGGMNFSNLVLGLMPYVTEEKIPCIVHGSNYAITRNNNGYMFRDYMNDDVGAEIATRFAFEKLGGKVAIITNNNEMGMGGGDRAVAALLKYYNVKPTTREIYNVGDKDFTAQLMKVAQSGATALVHWGHSVEAALIMRQMSELGLNKKIALIGSPDHSSSATLDLAKETANGVYTVTTYDPMSSNPKNKAYVERFQKLWNLMPDAHAGMYDGIYILKAAIEKVGAKGLEGITKEVRQRITDAMFGITYQGVVANYTVAKSGDMLWDYIIIQITDGPKYVTKVVQSFHTDPK